MFPTFFCTQIQFLKAKTECREILYEAIALPIMGKGQQTRNNLVEISQALLDCRNDDIEEIDVLQL